MEFKHQYTVLVKDENDNCWGHGLFDRLEEAQEIAEAIESDPEAMKGVMSLSIGPEGIAAGAKADIIVTKITSLVR